MSWTVCLEKQSMLISFLSLSETHHLLWKMRLFQDRRWVSNRCSVLPIGPWAFVSHHLINFVKHFWAMKAKQTQNKSKASLRSTYVYGMYWQRAIYMLFSLNFSFELVLIQGSSMEVLCSDHLHLVLLGKPASGAKFWSWNHEILHWYILFISFIVCTLSLCNWKSKDFRLRVWKCDDSRMAWWPLARSCLDHCEHRSQYWKQFGRYSDLVLKRHQKTFSSALRALFWNRVIWLAFTSKIHCVSDPNVSDAAEEPKSQTGSKAVRASLNSSNQIFWSL